jgi:2,3-bisphosphoglycerate-dependent phosphoglycerate mutase
VRHCKAEGQPPEAPLTEEGFKQTEELAGFFTDKKIKRIISSPFKRAIQSIEPTAQKLGVEVEHEDRLAERVLSTEPLEDWMDKLAASYREMELKFPGGESSQEATNRALEVIEQLKAGGTENTIIVTHGNLMSLILKFYDDDFGYGDWKRLSNPDVYLLTLEENTKEEKLERLWC